MTEPSRAELIEEVDLALAAMRRVIVRAIDFGMTKPAVEKLKEFASAPRSPTHVPLPAAKPKPALPPAGRIVSPSLREDVIHNGVRVSFKDSTITFKTKSVEVSWRQLQIVEVLARAMPNIIPREELVHRAWPDLAKSSQDVTLSSGVAPMTEALASIGLKLNNVRKFGLSLTPEAA